MIENETLMKMRLKIQIMNLIMGKNIKNKRRKYYLKRSNYF